eukprot:scaffold21867_cov86-Isochrysis_galbana.AAC.1
MQGVLRALRRDAGRAAAAFRDERGQAEAFGRPPAWLELGHGIAGLRLLELMRVPAQRRRRRQRRWGAGAVTAGDWLGLVVVSPVRAQASKSSVKHLSR